MEILLGNTKATDSSWLPLEGLAGIAFEVYFFGVRLKPMSNNSATRALRDFHVRPPKTVAIMRLLPRWGRY